MAFYRAPEGFYYDPSIGKYFKESIIKLDNGKKSKVLVLFDPVTGNYSQETLAAKKVKHLALKIVLGLIVAFIIAFAINVWLNYSSYMNRTNPNNQNLLNEQSITVNHTINMEDYTGSVTGGGIFK